MCKEYYLWKKGFSWKPFHRLTAVPLPFQGRHIKSPLKGWPEDVSVRPRLDRRTENVYNRGNPYCNAEVCRYEKTAALHIELVRRCPFVRKDQNLW